MSGRSRIPHFCVNALMETGMNRAESHLVFTRKTELNVETGRFSLMRTTDDVNLSFMGIKEKKKGTTSINKTDDVSIKNAVSQMVELVASGEPDPANEIAEMQPSGIFAKGPIEPDVDLMYKRMKAFLEYSFWKHPKLILEQVILDHTAKHRYFCNSNGVSFHSDSGLYNFSAVFTSRDGTGTSSFNFAGASTEDLNEELHELGGVARLMEQSTEQIVTENLSGSFVGDVIVSPECMEDFVSIITGYLGDYPLVTGTSVFKDSLNEVIADERFTLHSMPVSSQLAGGYFFTGDGFKAENTTIIHEGVLKSFLLSLYGSRKTGLKKAACSGGFYVIDPGDTSFQDMLKSVRKGILLCRFSGGEPGSNGDFSGVAKNSYYIENGEIRYPVSETMVAGNLKDMLKTVKHISKERVNSGGSITPWITFSGITISGK
jgi:PmbA protein